MLFPSSSFMGMNRLKKIALKVMADELTEAEIGNLRDVFEAIDTDGSGSLSIQELTEALKNTHGTMQTTIENIMAGIDIDGDQELDYHEFLAATMKRNIFIREDKMRTAFQTLSKCVVLIPDLFAAKRQ